MEFLQRLAELVLARVQLKIYDQAVLNRYQALFDTELLGSDEILKRRRELLNEECREAFRYRELIALCGGNETGRWLLDLCLTALLEPDFQTFANENWKGITLDVVSGISGEENNYRELKKTARCAERILSTSKNQRLFLRNSFWAEERLLDFFLDEKAVDPRLGKLGVELFTGEATLGKTLVCQEIEDSLKELLERKDAGCVQIAGNDGCGRKFLLQKACQSAGVQMLFVDVERLSAENQEKTELLAKLILREALLLKCGVCLHHIENELIPEVVQYVLKPLREEGVRVYLCTRQDAELIPILDQHVDRVLIPAFGRNERIILWEGMTKEQGIREYVDCVSAGAKFKLSAKEIRKAIERIARSRTVGPVEEAEISRACEEVLLRPACGSIKRIQVQYTLDDLKLLPEQKQVLHNICAHVWYRHRVYDEWNMDSKYAYGKNVSALFCGPPGTGKTMAVHVLATMMNIPLYRVDLSQVVDKYIGETEKRLEQIFDTAEKNNTILFFDEADSIFGKRSEVNEAKDKYANTEVSYILQRIEQYDGIVILATNYRKNIDEAFMRRIRYMVEFPLPNIPLREEIWRTSFAKELPTKELNYEYLAEQFELSGGAIKNIVLNAAFLAAAEDRPVKMQDVLRSIRNENVKTGKRMLAKDFGIYAEMMEEADKQI